jgi:outer membrane receptor protein involved in Fe transport
MRAGNLVAGVSAFAMAMGVVASNAQAQTPTAPEAEQSDETDEIVVTATGRGERAFDVPLAMSVTSGAELERLNVSSLESVQRIEPALNVRTYGPAVSSFIIRGIVSQAQPTTGIYYGEAPLIGGHQTEGLGDPTPSLRLHDLDRVEVLKGPQGTLFGAGSMAGTIRAIPASPDTSDFFGAVSAMAGVTEDGNPLYSGDFMLNAPLSSTFAVRLVGWGEEGGGFIDQTIPFPGGRTYEDINDVSVRGGRISAMWAPDDVFDLTAAYTRQEIESDGGFAASLGSPEYQSTEATLTPYNDELEIASLTAHLRGMGGTFTAVASYTDYLRYRLVDTSDAAFALGYDGGFTFATPLYLDASTFELRYASQWEGPFQLVIGAFYQEDQTRVDSTVIKTEPETGATPCTSVAGCLAAGFPIYPVPPFDPSFDPSLVVPGTPVYITDRLHETQQVAYYAQGELDLTSTLTATLGVRYFEADLHDEVSLFLAPFAPVDSVTQSKTSYNASLTWEPNEDFTGYVRAASGFRIGGLNDTITATAFFGIDIPSSYAPDSLWNYEIGAKVALFDRRVLLDGAIFHIDWENQQLPAADPTQAVLYTINATSTDVNGFELTARTQPTEGLSVDFGVTYVDATLAGPLPAEATAAGAVGAEGDRILNQPQWSGSVHAEYVRDLTPNWAGYLGGSLVYRGEAFDRFESDPERIEIPASTVLGLTLGVRSDNVEVGLVADNITNEYAIYGVEDATEGTPLPDLLYVGRPRTISVRVRTNF